MILFHVSAYSHQKNEWARYLITATDVLAAQAEMEEYLKDSGFAVRHTRRICSTTDRVFTEV